MERIELEKRKVAGEAAGEKAAICLEVGKWSVDGG